MRTTICLADWYAFTRTSTSDDPSLQKKSNDLGIKHAHSIIYKSECFWTILVEHKLLVFKFFWFFVQNENFALKIEYFIFFFESL